MIIIDPKGDSALIRRLQVAARKAGRLNDFYQVAAEPSRSTYAGTIG